MINILMSLLVKYAVVNEMLLPRSGMRRRMMTMMNTDFRIESNLVR